MSTRSHPSSPRRHRTRFGLAVAGALAVVASTFVAAVPASAAAVVPFNPAQPTVFVGYNTPTTLATADISSGGYDLATLRAADTYTFNALGFNTADNYLYAWDVNEFQMLRIDSVGGVDELPAIAGLDTAQPYNQGTFGLGDDEGTYFLRVSASTSLWAIDVDGLSATEITLQSPVENVSDIVYRDGYIWGYDGRSLATRFMYRIDPSNGAVSRFDLSSLALNTQPYGGQWLYGNGNFGLTGNGNGTVYQLAVEGADTASPVFSVVSTNTGIPTTNNDAASVPGAPADLVLEKTGDESFVPGEEYTYTITVTNDGAGDSSGSVVTDDLPAGLQSPASSTDGCEIAAGVLTCSVGPLEVGASTVITVTGVAAANATSASLTNSASVIGNEEDPDETNNTATFTPAAPAPELTLVKSADTELASEAGQVITYSFEVTNTGNVPVSDISIAEGEFSGAGTLGEVVCPAGAAELAPAAVVVCEAEYTVVQADLTGDPIENSATAEGVAPGGAAVVSEPSAESVPTLLPAPALSLVKSADTELATEAGQVITYSFEVTNTGNVPVSDITITEGDFSGAGTLGEVVCPAGAAELAPEAVVVCEAEYTVVQADLTGDPIENSATAEGLAPGGAEVVSATSEETVPTALSEPALSLVKSADTELASEAGQVITYSFEVTNTGNVPVSDITITEGDFSGAGTLGEVVCPEGAAELAPGAVVVCEAEYTVVQADLTGDPIENAATAEGLAPGGAEIVSDPSEESVPTLLPAPELTLVKSADTELASEAGQVITYSFEVTNTGNVPVSDITITEGDFSGAGTLGEVVCAEGAAELAPEAVVVCEAEYTVVQADLTGDPITNSATAEGVAPGGAEIVSDPSEESVPTLLPAPELSLVKSSETELAAEAGQVIVYTFEVTNTGNVPVSGVSIAEGEFSGAGTLGEVVCPEAAALLAPGDVVICEAEYTVVQADLTGDPITNSATAEGVAPGGAEI
ncbi:DUF7507 domain-containing protein, partial [Microbacterium sp. NPDC055903]